MDKPFKNILTAALLSWLFFGTGCASTAQGITKGVLDKIFEPEPSSMEAKLDVSEDVNPDAEGRASPFVARIYELKSLSVFNSADFFGLYEQDVALLGDDMLVRAEHHLRPGEKKVVPQRDLKPDTRFIGVIAAYRDIENATWRKAIEIELNEKTSFVVEFKNTTIEIHKTK